MAGNVAFVGVGNAMNGILPCEGPKALPWNVDFASSADWDFDLTNQFLQGAFSALQCMFVDNSGNGSTIRVTIEGTNHTFLIRANSCGFYTLIVPDSGPKFRLTSAGGVIVPIELLNYYIPPYTW